MRYPDKFAIILGCAKSGTTSLYEYLVRHSQICRCSVKEPSTHQDFLARGNEEYKKLWEWDPETHRWAMEASTAYTLHPETPNFEPVLADFPARFAEMDADFRFLYIVRDPLERAKSHLSQYLVQGQEFSYSKPAELEWLVETSRYAHQLEPWVKRFGRDRIRVLMFEDLRDRPKSLMNETYQFLGLPAGPDPPSNEYNATDGVLNTDLWNRLRDFSPLREVYRKLPVMVRSKARNFLNPNIEDELSFRVSEKKRFLNKIEEDILKIEECGVDLSRWNLKV